MPPEAPRLRSRLLPLLDESTEADLVARARGGDKKASGELFRALQPVVRQIVRRLVGHPDDTDDLAQDALVEGVTALNAPAGEGAPPLSTALEASAVRGALAFLAEQRRWRPAAQIHAQAAAEEQDLIDELLDVLGDEDFSYDVREHVAFCLTCVGRSLPLEQWTALVLVDVLGFDLPAAAALAAADEEHVAAYLDAARAATRELYQRLCRLSSEQGACDQCRGLRDAAPEGRKGPRIDGEGGVATAFNSLDDEQKLTVRLRVVRDANLDAGGSRVLHDQLYRLIARLETNRATPPKKDDEIPAGRARWEMLQPLNN